MKSFALTGQLAHNGQPFPLAIEVPAESLDGACSWAFDTASELSMLASEHGVVLVRGLPLAKPEEFDAVVSAFGFRIDVPPLTDRGASCGDGLHGK